MCNHKLNGVRNRGYVNEYRQCILCKKKIYKHNPIKRFVAYTRAYCRGYGSAYEYAIVKTFEPSEA